MGTYSQLDLFEPDDHKFEQRQFFLKDTLELI